MTQFLAVFLGIALLGATTAAPAYAAAKDSTSQEVAYGAGSFFGTLLYAPFKTSFCVVGGRHQRADAAVRRDADGRQGGQRGLRGHLGDHAQHAERAGAGQVRRPVTSPG